MSLPLVLSLLVVVGAPPQQPPSPGPTEKAKELAVLVLPESRWREAMAQSAHAQADVYRKLYPGRPADLDARLQAELMKAFPYEETLAFEVRLVAQHYTAEELDQVLAFYASPVGRKSLLLWSEMNREVLAFWSARMKKAWPDIARRTGLTEPN